MKWNKLKSNECPRPGCGMPLRPTIDGHECTVCDFEITKRKFDHIVDKQYKGTVYRNTQDNFYALQNLGREKVTEDFGDSLFADRDDDVDYDRDL